MNRHLHVRLQVFKKIKNKNQDIKKMAISLKKTNSFTRIEIDPVDLKEPLNWDSMN